ncbi:molybdenum cofactor synthesis 1 isoform 1 [Salpingoeca rosetta]|uniref:cyclic pyranopterin monophosphate synthase n=1 Tax=Salpingoeca rosetta (strain ATCC 50818 / BSB-021) TaxID=946362 RepID=F2U0U3_SALR5|nr:molybdenum cofactor synthesis 1 isoform 1 [Salpingoeca rosetta]EGD80517.1 molybdenum cofactor synthesis 1 isoform 1 [Salpingoeca rosetta]|eukprot:XP_004997078.1 molybdenum cofactor synthesis 1 isoform 1 [Salpingoeca rosetta]
MPLYRLLPPASSFLLFSSPAPLQDQPHRPRHALSVHSSATTTTSSSSSSSSSSSAAACPAPLPSSLPTPSTSTLPLARSSLSPFRLQCRAKSTLTHVDEGGRARMVDVGMKHPQRRTAIASSRVRVSQGVADVLLSSDGAVAKGNVLQIAHFAGICGAKHTATLIPLCHNIPIDAVDMRVVLSESGREVVVLARARTTGVTGVEMEAMTAVSVAALTVYDMVKAIDKSVCIAETRLLLKSGGKSGLFIACDSSSYDDDDDDGGGGGGGGGGARDKFRFLPAEARGVGGARDSQLSSHLHPMI